MADTDTTETATTERWASVETSVVPLRFIDGAPKKPKEKPRVKPVLGGVQSRG
jgi:hypothetical protein